MVPVRTPSIAPHILYVYKSLQAVHSTWHLVPDLRLLQGQRSVLQLTVAHILEEDRRGGHWVITCTTSF